MILRKNMTNFTQLPPLSLYIHIPWCVQKCPYCDFNSHGIKAKTIDAQGYSPEIENIPQEEYVQALLEDLDQDLKRFPKRPLQSIFIGGGTPSIMTASSIKAILDGVRTRLDFAPNIEITLEANPGTVDAQKFVGFKEAGVTRISIGIQSFNQEHLKVLGRIHNSEQAKQAVAIAKAAGFKEINVDLMYGLPDQTIEQALEDIKQAVALDTTHLSWYQLTIEPNTLFFSRPPQLPQNEAIEDMEDVCRNYLKEHGFSQYEVSAYSKGEEHRCHHNIGYWQFHDYLGIGCGAHGKITLLNGIMRTAKTKHPKGYLQGKYLESMNKIAQEDLLFEYFLNQLRLFMPISKQKMLQYTQIKPEVASQALAKYINNGMIRETEDEWILAPTTYNFLNNILVDLMPESTE